MVSFLISSLKTDERSRKLDKARITALFFIDSINRCINKAKKIDLGIGKKLFLTKSMHYKRKRGLNSNKNCRDRKNAIFLRPRWYPNFFKGVLTQTINFFKGVLI